MWSCVNTARRTCLPAATLWLAAFIAAPAQASTETVVHSFDPTGVEGTRPLSALIKVGNLLYGTTPHGGAYNRGTVFAMTRAGVETVLHAFKRPPDGAIPRGRLHYLNGVLYGTTTRGGTGGCTSGCGTVYQIPIATNTETVLYSFQGGSDGEEPTSGLVDSGGILYGTTLLGGTAVCTTTYSSCGTFFSLTVGGVHSVLYSFKGNQDGANPFGSLLVSGANLFGTTGEGGATCPDLPAGCGTVFKLTPIGGGQWSEHVRYRFLGGNDGADPLDGLIRKNGVFYGTTFYGGASKAGTVFGISGTTETFIHAFTGGDGSYPSSTLTDVGGTLYGATSAGGNPGCGYLYHQIDGCGTIFQLIPGGIQTLYSFQPGNDGGNPYTEGGLLNVGGDLYGTTYGGGSQFGTVFKFTP